MTEDDQNAFKFTLTSSKCRRFLIDKIYTGDGLFILRIKTLEVCREIEINLKYKGKDLKHFPICVEAIYPENCECKKEVADVLKNLKCDLDEQIIEDLKPFKNVNFSNFRAFVRQNYEKSRSAAVCNYVIKDGRIYRKCYGEYVGFKMFIDHILSHLIRKVKFPDMEFFVNLGDWPLIKKTKQEEVMPMFSWCGSKNTHDIVIPTYDLTESTLNMLQKSILDIFSVQREKFKWNEKEEKAFFRGRDSRRERLELVTLAKTHPNLFNCTITNFFFYKDEIADYGPKVPHISFFEFFKFKYQINIDGTVAAYRFPYLLAGNSVVLKQESQFYEHFYRKLTRYEHFVPFSRNPHIDLVKRVKFLKNHDQDGLKIMKNARNFVRDNLAPRNIFCYYLQVFKEFSSRISSPIEVMSDMDEVEVKNDDCGCEKVIKLRTF